VQKIAPTLERKRAAKQATRKRATNRKRETQKQVNARKQVVAATLKRLSTTTVEGYKLKSEAERLWKLLANHHGGKRLPTFETSTRGVTVDSDGQAWMRSGGLAGRAYRGANHIWLKAGYDWHTLAHELVHCAVGVRYAETNAKAHDEVFYYALKDLTERRFKVDINFSKVRRWGYDVDDIMRSQCRALRVHAKAEARRDAARQAS
jgi:hypothetical protein